MSVYQKLAALLETVATELEAPVAAPAAAPAKVAEAPAAPDPVAKVAALYKTVAGEELPAGVATKLAADAALVDVLAKVAEKGLAPTPLGEPSEKDANEGAAPVDKAERRTAAYDRFGRFLTENA